MSHKRAEAERNLQAETERLSVTLSSIGDGVLSTGLDGKIVLANAVCANLTGWSIQDSLGKPITDVLHLVNEKTGNPCKNPAEEVLRTRQIDTLA